MSSHPRDQVNLRDQLAERIYQYLRFESESSAQSLSESARESLTVAAECVEQAFGLTKPQSERPPSDELLHIYTKHVCGDRKTSQSLSQSSRGSLTQLEAAECTHKIPTPQLERPPSDEMLRISSKPPCGDRKPLQSSTSAQQSWNRKVRQNVSTEGKGAVQESKNQGNDAMKQDLHQDACEPQTKEKQAIKPGIGGGIKTFDELLEIRLRENDTAFITKRNNASHHTFLKKGEGLKRFASFRPPVTSNTARFAFKALNQNLSNCVKPPPLVVHDQARPISRRETFVKPKLIDNDLTCVKVSLEESDIKIESATQEKEEQEPEEDLPPPPRYNLRGGRKPRTPPRPKPKRVKKKATAFIECHYK